MTSVSGLSPCGESGLKFFAVFFPRLKTWSLPVWGEWIEIHCPFVGLVWAFGLSPCGESGLKFSGILVSGIQTQVSPRVGRVD